VKQLCLAAPYVGFFITIFVHDVVNDDGVVDAALSALLWTIPFGILYLLLTQLVRRPKEARCLWRVRPLPSSWPPPVVAPQLATAPMLAR
jgi:hypothetical protein